MWFLIVIAELISEWMVPSNFFEGSVVCRLVHMVVAEVVFILVCESGVLHVVYTCSAFLSSVVLFSSLRHLRWPNCSATTWGTN